ncbi:MAG: hypothetical protein D4S01_04500 [Dehalococcoidia bacterium]|nr:MAG: hypothetical protein D4S01_04500 [Dehalococcoidia bacterium]
MKPKDALAATYKTELDTIKRDAETIELTVDATDDYNYSRDMLKKLLRQAEASLTSLVSFAQQSEHPRAFEVLAGLLKTAGDLTNQLMTLQKTRHELDALNNPDRAIGNGGRVTNNAIFVGSTTELQRLIKDNIAGTIIDIEEFDDEVRTDG